MFRERGVGAITTSIISRRGPDFGNSVGGNASGRLLRDDNRYAGYELDGGTVSVGSGGYVGGQLHFDDASHASSTARSAPRTARRSTSSFPG